MKSIEAFNGLHGARVSRETIIELIAKAKRDEQFQVVERLEAVLSSYPDAKKFDWENTEPAFEVVPESMLHGLDYEESQDDATGLAKPVSPNEVYQMITDKVLKMIAVANKKDYKRKWEVKGYTIPFNFVSKKRYRGINNIMLTEMDILDNPFFLTFAQVQQLKGKVKKGTQGYEVVYFSNIYEAHNTDKTKKTSSFDIKKVMDFATENDIKHSEISRFPLLKYYNVFNGADIEGIDFDLDNFKIGFVQNDVVANQKNKLPIPEAVIKNYPAKQPKIEFGGSKAFYSPDSDLVKLPVVEKFETIQDYYRTMFHELSHSTGHKSRLDRLESTDHQTSQYAFEELTAEIGAIFLSAESGIVWHSNKNHAGYLKGWNEALTEIENDNKFVMKAATQAQKTADFVLQFDEKGDPLYFKDITELKPELMKNEKAKKVVAKKKPVKKVTTKKDLQKAVAAVKKTVVNKTVVNKTAKKKKPTVKVEAVKPQIVNPVTKQIALFGAKNGLKNPVIENIPAEAQPEPTAPMITENLIPGSLAFNRARPKKEYEYYNIEDAEIADFLGNVEKKNKESVVITLAGGQGSMKTRMLFKMMNAFAQNYKCGHASIEEHPESALYNSKVDQYLNDKAMHNITAPEISTVTDLHNLISQNDVVLIDSFPKLQEMCKGFEVDKDLRKKYDGKLFIIIFQLTTDGKMRGGSKSQFDGDIILLTESFPDYKENFVKANKNRYQNKSLDDLKFNIYQGKIIKPEPENLSSIITPVQPLSPIKFSFNTVEN
ncbi:ArdC family protein [Flavobacterium sp.]|uniref:ArdC family protein n=1 Tax=Flavobacterium sp. TaxID=239 RepID=UPI002B4B0492|nr:zincin-like metallopeptidase domain-containing protein [Flavobacterium sp.]HLF53532.1 zincin-like metallopeptidase domain-containing protein [Flavobacterium sp.]